MVAAFEQAWSMLKALEEQQMFMPAFQRQNLTESPGSTDSYRGIDVGEGQVGMGTVHPAIYGMIQRRMKQMDEERLASGRGTHGGSYSDEEEHLPNLNLHSMEQERGGMPERARTKRFVDDDAELRRRYFQNRTPMIDGPPDDSAKIYSTNMWYPKNVKRTRAPQTHSYRDTHPTAREIRERMGL